MPVLHTTVPGFADPVLDSQSAFRNILDAMARPGRIVTLAQDIETPDGLASAAASVCLCLFDQGTSVWLDPAVATPENEAFLKFHTGCTMTDTPQSANFAVCSGDNPQLDWGSFSLGSPEYPDRSTTILVQAKSLSEDNGIRMSGPGIETDVQLNVGGVTAEFWQTVRENNALFPLGVDFILVSEDKIVGLPRSTRVEG